MSQFVDITKMQSRRLTIQRRTPQINISRPATRLRYLTNFSCVDCCKNINESELAAANKNDPRITCCKCIGKICCVSECEHGYYMNAKTNVCLEHYFSHEISKKCLSKGCERITSNNRTFCQDHICAHSKCKNEIISSIHIYCALHQFKLDRKIEKEMD